MEIYFVVNNYWKRTFSVILGYVALLPTLHFCPGVANSTQTRNLDKGTGPLVQIFCVNTNQNTEQKSENCLGNCFCVPLFYVSFPIFVPTQIKLKILCVCVFVHFALAPNIEPNMSWLMMCSFVIKITGWERTNRSNIDLAFQFWTVGPAAADDPRDPPSTPDSIFDSIAFPDSA